MTNLSAAFRFPTLSQFPLPWNRTISEVRGHHRRGDEQLRNVLAENTLSDFLTRERAMDWNRVEGNWKQVKGKVKEQWGKLTDDDLDVIAGEREKLVGKIQERYGIAKEEAEKQIANWNPPSGAEVSREEREKELRRKAG